MVFQWNWDIILCNKNLDFLFFQVVVREANTVERRSATATMTVNVINANDNVPVFPAAAYQSTISAGGYTPSNGVTVATVMIPHV